MKGHTPKLLAYMAISALVFGLSAFIDWLPERTIAKEAAGIDDLGLGLLLLSVVIMAIVVGTMAYSIIHFRAKPGEDLDGVNLHGHHGLEVVWTVIPFLIVTAVSVISYLILVNQEQPAQAGTKPLKVDVNAFQFGWSFDYPDEGVQGSPTLVLVKDRLAAFTITSPDVLHSFWVPEARLKVDAVPGLRTRLQWTPTELVKPGPKEEGGDNIDVVCAELCGEGHSSMLAPVEVLEQSDFDDWVDEQGEDEESEGK